MNLKAIIEYNKEQAKVYEWTPQWFGAFMFDSNLVQKIKDFQKSEGLTDDGMCGPSTYRRMWTHRESLESEEFRSPLIKNGEKFIVHNGNPYPIKWDKVVLWNDANGLPCNSYSKRGGREDRNPTMFVNHWDVCLSSKSCAKVLNKRGLSVHFLIDNDGTIFQCMDTQHIAYHAGSYNQFSIGVEISCAYSLKYQSWYQKRGFGTRPIMEGVKVHGKTLKPFLGFYHAQMEALAALWEVINRACPEISLATPEEKDTVSKEIAAHKFNGFCSHFHLTKGKIDVAGVDLDEIKNKAIKIRG